MKLFFKKIGKYVAAMLTIAMLLNFFVFPKNTNVLTYKNNLLKDRLSEVLVLGNSHTFFGVNPSYMQHKTINAASKSRKIETDYLILEKNKEQLQHLKMIVLPISYYTLFTEDLTVEEKRLYYNYFDIAAYDQGVYRNSLVIHESFKELVEDALGKPLKISKLGWRANSETYEFNQNEIKERIGDINQRIARKDRINENVAYLKGIARICKELEIKLMLLLPPYHPDFYKATENVYDSKIKSVVGSLGLKNVSLIDSKELHIVSDELFENVDHLNKKGAHYFTIKLDSIIKTLIDE